MKKIPEWQYPLYKESDKAVYTFLEKLGKSKTHPNLLAQKRRLMHF